jgi:hypothetical protein
MVIVTAMPATIIPDPPVVMTMEVAEEAPEEIVASTVDNLNVGMKPVAKNNDG